MKHWDAGKRSESRPAAIVISDVLIYREGIAAGLARIGDLEVVAAIAAEALPETLAARDPAIAFVDISRTRSRDAARTARAIAPAIQIIGFGMTNEDEGLAGAEAGITAFVGHDGTIADLNEAARRVLKGDPVCPPRLTSRLLERIVQLARAPRPAAGGGSGLTRREHEIARLVEEGLSNKEIACTLRISPATVKNHVHMILDKLNLPRRRMVALRGAAAGRHQTADR